MSIKDPSKHKNQNRFSKIVDKAKAGRYGRTFSESAINKILGYAIKFPNLSADVLDDMLNVYVESNGRYVRYGSSNDRTDFIIEPNHRDRASINLMYAKHLKTRDVSVNFSELIQDDPDVFVSQMGECFLNGVSEARVYSNDSSRTWKINRYIPPACLQSNPSDDGCDSFLLLIDTLFKGVLEGTTLKDLFLDWSSGVVFSSQVANWHWLLGSKAKGIGKSSLQHLMSQMFSPFNVESLDENVLHSGFLSGGMAYKKLIISDDSGAGLNKKEKKKLMESLKKLTGSKQISVNQKGLATKTADRYFGCIFSTNEISSIPLEEGDRRWCVINTSTTHADYQKDFFFKLGQDLSNPSKIRAFYEFLRSRYESKKEEIDMLITGNAPRTAAKSTLESLYKSSAEHSVSESTELYSFGSQYGFMDSSLGKEPFFLGCFSEATSIKGLDCINNRPVTMDDALNTVLTNENFVKMKLRGVLPDNSLASLTGRSLNLWVRKSYLDNYEGGEKKLKEDVMKSAGVLSHVRLGWSEYMMDLSGSDKYAQYWPRLKESYEKKVVNYKSPVRVDSTPYCLDEITERVPEPVSPFPVSYGGIVVSEKAYNDLKHELSVRDEQIKQLMAEIEAIKKAQVTNTKEVIPSSFHIKQEQDTEISLTDTPAINLDHYGLSVSVRSEELAKAVTEAKNLLEAVSKSPNNINELPVTQKDIDFINRVNNPRSNIVEVAPKAVDFVLKIASRSSIGSDGRLVLTEPLTYAKIQVLKWVASTPESLMYIPSIGDPNDPW